MNVGGESMHTTNVLFDPLFLVTQLQAQDGGPVGKAAAQARGSQGPGIARANFLSGPP